ncbi:MAG TPA: ornithine cyclodeaminase family protein [Bryobacteraceae bacterium]|jgi:ornithine cyclodeaminase/alanine dehydrogenase-like protein (mu-crystallin family)
MLYLTEDDVRRFLPIRECIALMREAFQRLSTGAAINQPRRRLILPTRSVLHYMAGSDGRYFGAKIYASNPRRGAHFLFLLYRADDGEPLAILEANHLGQIRTGAASGLATQLLARPDSRVATVIGSGFQARTQAEALAAAVPIERILVWSRSPEKRARFVEECRLTIPVEAAASAEDATRRADILTTATNSAEPVVESTWVAPGAHVNAMGSNQAQRREIPAELVKRARLIAVDSREQSRIESGDLILSLSEEDWSRTVELQDVIAGRARRERTDEITLFKSNGLAVEDVITAGYVYERAVAEGAGRTVYS